MPVAEIDTRELGATLRNLKQGDEIALALPNGEIASGRVNLVSDDAGTLRIGGSLPNNQQGSFALALDQYSRLYGQVLLPGIALAYRIEPDVHPGSSRMEALALADVICHRYIDPEPDGTSNQPQLPQPAQAFAAAPGYEAQAIVVPSHSSRPDAPAVLYLDFDGAVVNDTYWNDGITINAAAANLTEAQITAIWKGVAEAYSAFNIDVTTNLSRYTGKPAGKRMRCIITPTYQWYSNSTGIRGVALINSFARAGSFFASDTPCWIFVPSWYSYIPLVTSHELGHTLGLRHDGLSSGSPRGRQEYFGGHGTDAMSWGPIMGNPSTKNVIQWSKGEYAYASNSEDDLAILSNATNGFGFYNDGIANTRAGASSITIPAAGAATKAGALTTSADEAWFTFTLTATKTCYLSAAPSETMPGLDIRMELQDSGGTTLASDNPSLALDALIEKTLSAGTYYIKIKGESYSDGVLEGYTRYGSIGQYTLTAATAGTVSAPQIIQHPQNTNATSEDGSFTLTASASGAGTLRYQWQRGGVDLVSNERHPNVTSATLTVFSPTALDGGQYRIKVRNAGGEVTSSAATVNITAPPPPVIVTPPQSKTVFATDYSFSLSVSATGAGSLRYQWQKNGVDLESSSRISGGNSSSLYIYSPEASDAGEYKVKVSNAGGDTLSSGATITVTLPPPPVITTPPANVTKVAGSTLYISLSVSATGSGYFSYQWLKNGVELQTSTRISDVTSNYLNIYDYTPDDNGNYTVRVTNKGGSVVSAAAVVTITLPAPPTITTHPADRTVLAGDYQVYFSVSANGVGLKYCWQKDGVDLVASSRYDGITSNWLYIYNPQASDAGKYTVRVYNAAASLTSNFATLTVTMPSLPVIGSQTGNVSIVEGESFSLSCSVSSVNNTNYQWYRDNQPVNSATSTYYNKYEAALTDAGVYRLAATNPSGTVYSANITVSVSPAVAPVFTRHPETQSIYVGKPVTFEAAATGRPVPTYQWYKDGVAVGYGGATYTLSNPQVSHAGSYTVKATNKGGVVTSNTATLSILAPDSGKPLGIYPANKAVGAGRITYRVWVRSNSTWTVANETPWVSISRTKGAYEDAVEITVAPNPVPVERQVVLMIAGQKHTLIQRAAGTPVRELWAAGSNRDGQLGAYKPFDPYYPKAVPLTGIKSVAVGGGHTLFLKNDGTLWAVGGNEYGQLGDGTTTTRTAPVQVATAVTAVAASYAHSLFIKTDGSLWSMGDNTYGQLGNGTTSYYGATATPVRVAENVVAVIAAGSHSLFRKTDGTLWGMGYNGSGQLGLGAGVSVISTPAQIATNVKDMAAGGSHSLFIKTDDTLWATGQNIFGQLGDGTTTSVSTPKQVGTNIRSVGAGGQHSIFVKTDGTLWIMGRYYVGDSTVSDQSTPLQKASDVQYMATGDKHELLIKTDGTLWAMGYNTSGQLGDGTANTRGTPVVIAAQASQVFAGESSSFYIDAEGQLWAAGNNNNGALGIGAGSASVNCAPVHIASDIHAVAAGSNHTLLLTTGSAVLGFGANGSAQLADGSTLSRYQPVKIADNARSISAGSGHTLVIKSDGTLWAAGNNEYGQCGDQGSATNYKYLTPLATGIKAAFAGNAHSLFIDTAGALWGVGSNSYNVLGAATPGQSNIRTPLQITSGAQAIATTSDHSLMLKTDATLWSAGNNWYGQLGRPSGTTSFAQVDTGISAIATNNSYSLWVKTDGSLWAAGYNSNGQFGGSTVTYYTTTAVLTATNARSVAAGSQHSLHIDNSNGLWSSGNNEYGQLADGTTTNRNTYKKIAANIDSVTAGASHTLFIATGDIRLDPPPPPAITGFSPAAGITAQTKVTITGTNLASVVSVYFGTIEADSFTVDSPTQISAYAPVIPPHDGGRVHLGSFDGVASSTATYSASYAPVLGDAIPEQTVRLGSSISIDAPALGAPDPQITWKTTSNSGTTWNNLPADLVHSVDTHGTLTLSNVPLSLDGNHYQFIATNAHGTASSVPFKLTVVFPPEVTLSPISQTVMAGASATLTAAFTGNPSPALQWQTSTDAGLSWTDISGATNTTLTLNSVSAAMNTRFYRCVASNLYGSATTTRAELGVAFAPTQTNPQSSQTGLVGGSANISVAISSNPPATYQWQVSTDGGSTWTNLANGSGVTGADSASLALANASADMNGYIYRCAVSNSHGSIITQPTTLNIVASPFVTPYGLALHSGTLYVTDRGAHTVHRVSLNTGIATLLAGAAGVSGTTNSITGANARFNGPTGIALAPSGAIIYVADTGNHRLRHITQSGVVSSYFSNSFFNAPGGLAMTETDALYITESQGHVIDRIYDTGTSYRLGQLEGQKNLPGDTDGYYASFNSPTGIATTKGPAPREVYIADSGNHTIRLMFVSSDTTYSVSTHTLAGSSGTSGSNDGMDYDARFNHPEGLATDAAGNLYIADTRNHTIRLIPSSTPAVVTTLAGKAGAVGFSDGTGTIALFNNPAGLALDASGSTLYIADTGNAVIRKLEISTRKVTTLGTTAATAPVITGHPQNISATAGVGGPLTLTFSATGSGILSSKWQKDGVDIAASGHCTIGANSLTINNHAVTDTGQYRAVVSNAGGTVYSNPAAVTISATSNSAGGGTGGGNSGGGGGGGGGGALSLWYVGALVGLLAAWRLRACR